MPDEKDRTVRNTKRGLEQGAEGPETGYSRTRASTPADMKDFLESYQPDEEFLAKRIRYEELAGRAVMRRKNEDGSETRLHGHICLPYQDKQGRTRMLEVNVSSWEELNRIRHTARFKDSVRLLEAADAFQTGSYDTDTAYAANDEYHPIMLGPFNRQLYLYDFLDMSSKAFEAYNHNPLAKAIVQIIVNFTLGQGLKVIAAHPKCQKEWDDFAKRVDFENQMIRWERDLSIIGEAHWRKGVDSQGEATARLLDASAIWEIITDPKDISKRLYYHLQTPTQYQLVYKQGDKVSEYWIEDIPAEQMISTEINNTVGEKRGRSDLFPILGWLKRFKDFYNALIIKAQVSNSFVRAVTVTGSQDDVDRLADDEDFNTIPPPGSTIFQNDKVRQEFLSAEVAAGSGPGNAGEDIRSIVGVAVNIPPEYLGVQSSQGSRATALIHAEPFGKFIEARQQVTRQAVRQLYDFVIATAMKKGRLPELEPRKQSMARVIEALRSGEYKAAVKLIGAWILGSKEELKPIDRGCEVVMPEFQPEDRSPWLRDLESGVAQGFMSKESAAKLWAEKMKVRDFDWDDEKAKLEAEQKAAMSAIPEMPPSAARRPGGGPAPTGQVPGRPGGATQIDKPATGDSEDNRRYRADTKMRGGKSDQ